MATANAAAAFLRAAKGRAQIREQLERVDAEMVRWQEHDADRALPLEYKRYPPVPEMPREELHELHARLVQELIRLT